MSMSRAERWARGLAAVDELGTANLSAGTVSPSGHKVGHWVATARRQFAAGKLTPQRVADLEARGIIWDHKEAAFQENLAELDRFIADHGHTHLPPDRAALRAWLCRRRSEYALGLISNEHIAALRERGVSFNPLREKWVTGLYELDRYLAEHGTMEGLGLHVTKDGFKLGIWVSDRRNEYRRGTLSPEKVRALNQRKMSWNPAKEQRQNAAKALEEYRSQYGHTQVPSKYRTCDGFPLGRWAPRLTAAA